MNIHPNQSFDLKVEDKVYRRNMHHLTRRYPKKISSPVVPNSVSNDSDSVTPKRTLRCTGQGLRCHVFPSMPQCKRTLFKFKVQSRLIDYHLFDILIEIRL